MTDLTAPVPPAPDAIGDAVPAAAPARAVEWRISDTPVPYPDALAEMEARVEAIRAGTAPELVWLLEHPPLYTAGTSAREEDLLEPGRFPVYQAGRGGQFTYHGPGQRVAYVMLDLKTRGADIRAFVQDMEEWLIRTLAAFNIRGERREGRVGIWVDKGPYGGAPGQEDKIAAIGVRVRRWVSFHGVALNVEPDLSHFAGIVPCGISEHGVTSIVALGHLVAMEDVDAALIASFAEVFGGAAAEE
ncbi:lipoyl(octanoyl) transferase LipB [Azospirillum argentinense]|uniref:Octanoyltransferase n=1 Tax=Azospirillum argentinense TaxID=2970906 RepID=A0A5B0KW42_9PROT|nr:lipoyl(octanoyl) transferase LipB [Azospirillum argentinense]KAA1056947.1 Octanoate-[acyl-carrier-protein]-protein-N-octanoyltransferase [Azospirillum argentinense]